MTLKTEPFVLNIGPVHPSTHGVYRMRATLDGEVVLDIEPVFGYLHRGIEKLAEERTYTGFIPLTDRLDYLASMSNNLGYCIAVEKLAGIKVPERAEYIRVIIAELQRLASHCIAVGAFLNDCGAYFTPFLYNFREREKILDLFDMVCGQRLTYNYMRIGGVSQDVPAEFLPALEKYVNQMNRFMVEFEFFLRQNEILLARAKGVGHPAEAACHRLRHQRPRGPRQRRQVGPAQSRPLLDLRPFRFRNPDRRERRLLRPLPRPDRGNEAEPAHHRAGHEEQSRKARSKPRCPTSFTRPVARPTPTSRPPRASWAISSSRIPGSPLTAATSVPPA